MGKDKTHLRLRVEDATGRVPAVAFSVVGTDLGNAISDAADGRPVDILGTLRRNRLMVVRRCNFILLMWPRRISRNNPAKMNNGVDLHPSSRY